MGRGKEVAGDTSRRSGPWEAKLSGQLRLRVLVHLSTMRAGAHTMAKGTPQGQGQVVCLLCVGVCCFAQYENKQRVRVAR